MINYYRNLEILDLKDKKKFFMIIFLGLIGSFFEVIGIGIIVPFVLVITDVNVLNNNVYISQFADYFSIEDRDKIIILFTSASVTISPTLIFIDDFSIFILLTLTSPSDIIF